MMIALPSAPIELDREEARERARQELSQPGYETDVSWPARVLEWLLEQLDRLLSGTAGAIPGGLATILLLAAIAAVIVVAILRTGPMARRYGGNGAVFTEPHRTAAEYRANADSAARAGDWTTAVIERFRAVVARLDERGIVEARPGHTADEVVRHAGERLPDAAELLRAGAQLFNQALYGARAATASDDAILRQLDSTVQHSRPHATSESVAGMAVPR